MLQRVLQQLREHERQRGGPVPRQRHRLEHGIDLLRRPQPLDQHRPQPVEEFSELDVFVAPLSEHLVHRRDRQNPVDRIVQRLPCVDAVRPRLQPQERRHGLQVVLHAVMNLLSQDAAQHRSPVLQRDCRVARNRRQQRAVLLRERRVAVAHQLADLPPLPAQRHPHGIGSRATLGPDDVAVLQHERRAGRAQRVHRRRHDPLQRFLQVQRLRHRLGDSGQRLELPDPALRLGVELRVLDRLRHLTCDRRQQVDLRRREVPRPQRADVERAGELVAREDRHRQDRLVLVLGQVGEGLETLVEMRLRRDHHRLARGRSGARDPFAGAHPRPAGHLLDAGAVRGAQDELAGLLVVEVDEAGIGTERVGDLARDEREHLLEVERRVDRGDRLGQKAQMAPGLVHRATIAPPRRAANKTFTPPADGACTRAVPSGPMSVPASQLLQTSGYLVADARGRVVGRVECPMYGTQPDIPDALSVRRGFARKRRLVPVDAVEQIDGSSGVVGLSVERDSLRSFL